MRKFLVAGVLVGFVIGVVAGQTLPSTFLSHPILTLKTMRRCPIGSEVILVGSINGIMSDSFARHGLGLIDYATVEGFVVRKSPNAMPEINYRIRTKSALLEVDPSYVEVLPGGHRFSTTPDGIHVIYDPKNQSLREFCTGLSEAVPLIQPKVRADLNGHGPGAQPRQAWTATKMRYFGGTERHRRNALKNLGEQLACADAIGTTPYTTIPSVRAEMKAAELTIPNATQEGSTRVSFTSQLSLALFNPLKQAPEAQSVESSSLAR